MDDDAGYAVAAWREDGRWSVAALPPRATESLDSFLAALRQLIAEGDAEAILANQTVKEVYLGHEFRL